MMLLMLMFIWIYMRYIRWGDISNVCLFLVTHDKRYTHIHTYTILTHWYPSITLYCYLYSSVFIHLSLFIYPSIFIYIHREAVKLPWQPVAGSVNMMSNVFSQRMGSSAGGYGDNNDSSNSSNNSDYDSSRQWWALVRELNPKLGQELSTVAENDFVMSRQANPNLQVCLCLCLCLRLNVFFSIVVVSYFMRCGALDSWPSLCHTL